MAYHKLKAQRARPRALSATFRSAGYVRGAKVETSPYNVRDPSAFSPDFQLERLAAKRDDIGRKMVKAAKAGNTDQMVKLAGLLSNTQAKIDMVRAKLT